MNSNIKLESLDTQGLLENSVAIYSSESESGHKTLENLVRYGELTLEQLSEENRKLNGIMTAAIERNIPITESHQTFLVDMSKLVKTRMTQVIDPAYQNRKLMISAMENDIGFASDLEYVSEATNPYGDAMKENLDIISKNTLFTSRGLYEACDILVSPNSPLTESMRDDLRNGIMEKMEVSLKFEFEDIDHSDLPILFALMNTREALKDTYKDKEGMNDVIDKEMDKIEENLRTLYEEYELKVASETGFNPNPFSLNNLTPFDTVGVRTMTRAMTDLINADTDEAVDEALIQIGKIQATCEAYGPEILTEKDNVVKKLTRKMANGSEKLANKASSLKKDNSEVKDNLKRTVDPFAKLIEDTYAKMKKADDNERRNMVIQGGLVNKISRAIKRGLFAMIAGSVLGGPITGVIITGITILTSFAIDKHMDKKVKNQILQELENELEMVEEKIEDSRGDEDKSKKYELMRIRAKLKKDIDRIQLGLKY